MTYRENYLINMLNAKEEKMTTRNQTRWHNLEFLKTDLKFSQLGNSAVFKRNSKFFISPAVSEGQHGKYWIDIREANLDKVVQDDCFLMPRIVPDLFILEKIHQLKSLLSTDLMEYRPHSGKVWGIYMIINMSEGIARLVSKKDSNKQITAKLIFKNTIMKKVNEMLA
jgi:hypothetical protein